MSGRGPGIRVLGAAAAVLALAVVGVVSAAPAVAEEQQVETDEYLARVSKQQLPDCADPSLQDEPRAETTSMIITGGEMYLNRQLDLCPEQFDSDAALADAAFDSLVTSGGGALIERFPTQQFRAQDDRPTGWIVQAATFAVAPEQLAILAADESADVFEVISGRMAFDPTAEQPEPADAGAAADSSAAADGTGADGTGADAAGENAIGSDGSDGSESDGTGTADRASAQAGASADGTDASAADGSAAASGSAADATASAASGDGAGASAAAGAAGDGDGADREPAGSGGAVGAAADASGEGADAPTATSGGRASEPDSVAVQDGWGAPQAIPSPVIESAQPRGPDDQGPLAGTAGGSPESTTSALAESPPRVHTERPRVAPHTVLLADTSVRVDELVAPTPWALPIGAAAAAAGAVLVVCVLARRRHAGRSA